MQRCAESLSNSGYEVELVGRFRKSSIPLNEKSYKQTRISCRFDKGKRFYSEYNFRLFWYLLRSKFDLCCGVDLDTLLPVFLASKLKSKKWTFDSHELFTEVPELRYRPEVRNVWESLEKYLVPRASKPYTVCESIAEEYSKRYRKDFAIIRNIPPSKSDFITEFSREAIFIYRGAVNVGRGLEEAILAIREINAGLLIAGDGDIFYDLRKLVRSNRLNEKVAFTGYLEPAELDKISLNGRAGLNLLTNSSLSYYYSLANKFFDYVQLGLPQISMNFPEYQKLNEKYEVAHLINSLNVDEVSEAMAKVLNDGAYHIKLHTNCLRAKNELCWEEEEPRLLTHYKSYFT